MTDLVAGQRLKLKRPELRFSIDCGNPQLLGSRFSAVTLFLSGDQASSVAPAYALGAAEKPSPFIEYDSGFTTSISLDRLPAEVTRVQAIVYVTGGAGTGTTFMDLSWIEVRGDDFKFRIDLVSCGNATLHLVDAYRHDGGWRVLANGQGFNGGLGVIGSQIGIHLDSSHGLADPLRAEPGDDSPDPDRTSRPRTTTGFGATGSGFVIGPNHVITNHHVIDGGNVIEVTNERFSTPGRVVFSDPHNDLALIRTEANFDACARFRDGIELHLGEDVVLVGFPLQDLLGQGPQVTAGNVSGLCGLGNNAAVLQYTAPTASGSSGGPILDASGLVIGVVRAGLAHDQIRSVGSASENINFGVKGSVARAFLDAAGLAANCEPGGEVRSRADIAREARMYAACIKVGF